LPASRARAHLHIADETRDAHLRRRQVAADEVGRVRDGLPAVDQRDHEAVAADLAARAARELAEREPQLRGRLEVERHVA
jgi:hypothetical protein